MKSSFSTFCSMYSVAIKLAFVHILHGRLRRGIYLLIRPIDYWRVFEFLATYDFLQPRHGERILDASSPKLFSMFIATAAGSDVYPIDIYDDKGLSDTMFYKEQTRNDHLHVLMGDMRTLPFPDASFDKVFTISVLEHVFPPVGGDTIALRELARVLKDDGVLVVTVPFARTHTVEYMHADIYERKRGSSDEQLFYQRRYDGQSLVALMQSVPEFVVERQEYICERLFHMRNKEICQIIAEGNKVKRLSLAPLYPLFAAVFLKRTVEPLPSSDAMVACLKLRKVSKRSTR